MRINRVIHGNEATDWHATKAGAKAEARSYSWRPKDCKDDCKDTIPAEQALIKMLNGDNAILRGKMDTVHEPSTLE